MIFQITLMIFQNCQIINNSIDDTPIVTRSNTIERLLALGLTPLPVAPHNPHKKRKDGSYVFTGKNPSYIDVQGKWELISHKEYQDKQPTQAELNRWFANPKNGVGVLIKDPYIFIDPDAKDFGSAEICKTEIEKWLDKNPQLKQTWTERTHSGGYRVAVKCKNKPNFTNFSLDGIGGKQHGEALGKGRFAVLAPTIGVSGNAYECLSNWGEVLEIDSLESIGIYPVKVEQKKSDVKYFTNLRTVDVDLSKPVEIKYRIAIEKVIKNDFQKYLKSSVDEKDDKSAKLTAIIRECEGWSYFLGQHAIGLTEDIKTTAFKVAQNLGIADRFEKIWDSVTPRYNRPGIWHRQGDEGCWQKLKFIAKDIFDAACPEDIKEKLAAKKSEKVTEHIFGDGTKIKLNKFIHFEHLEQWKLSKTLTHHIAIDSDSFYFPEGYSLSKGFNHFIASGLGTKKTAAAIKMALEGIVTLGLKVIIIAPRLTLLDNIAGRVQETWLDEYLAKPLPNTKVIDENLVRPLPSIKTINGNTKQDELDSLDYVDVFVTTLESLGRIAGKVANYIVIGDELNTIISQALANTSDSKKYKMFDAFKLVCNESHSNYLFDANLNNRVVNFAAFFCEKSKVIIKNTRKTTNCKITRLVAGEHDADGNFIAKVDSKSAVLDAIRRGNRVYFCSDSRKFIEKLEIVLRKEGKSTLALTSATSSQTWNEYLNEPNHSRSFKEKFLKAFPNLDLGASWAKELTSNPKAFFNKYGCFIDAFLQSPSGNTGLSVDIYMNKPVWQTEDDKYPFDLLVAYYCGVNDVEDVSQSLLRLRELNIERLLFVPEKSVIPLKKYESEEELEEVRRTTYNISTLEGSDVFSADEHAREAVRQTMESYPWYRYCIESQWLERIEKENYWVLLRYFLEQLGMEVIEENTSINEEDRESLKLAKEEIDKLDAELTHSALVFRDDEPKELKERNDRQTRARRLKTRFNKEYPGLIEHEELWTIEHILEFGIKRADTINTVRRYLAFKYPDIFKKRNDWYLFKSLMSGYPSEELFGKEETAKLAILRCCQFEKIADSLLKGEGINLESDDVLLFLSKVKKLSQDRKKIISAPNGKDWENNAKLSSFITNSLAIIGIPVKAQSKKKNSLKVLDTDKFNHPFYQYLIACVEQNYQDFMKEGHFVTKEAIEYWKKTGQVLQGFENFPISLSGNDLVTELSSEKPRQPEDNQTEKLIAQLHKDLEACISINDNKGLNTFVKLSIEDKQEEILLKAIGRLNKENQSLVKPLIDTVKDHLTNGNETYNEILNDLIERWDNKDFLKGWCEGLNENDKEWVYITNKLNSIQKQEITQLRAEAEAEKEAEYVTEKIKERLNNNQNPSFYWDRLTLCAQRLVKQTLSETENQKLAASI